MVSQVAMLSPSGLAPVQVPPRAVMGQTRTMSNWRDDDGRSGDEYDENAPLVRTWGPGMVAMAWLVVIAMFGSAVAAFVVLVFG